MKRKSLVAGLLGLALTLVLSTAMVGASRPPTEHYAQMNLGDLLNDSEIIDIMNRYNSKPITVYMIATGFSGTHHPSSRVSPERIVSEARAKAMQSFAKGAYGSLPLRISRFVSEYSETDISESAELQQKARSLLDLQQRLASAQSVAANGEPLIYAIKVSGDEGALSAMAADDRVKGFYLTPIATDVGLSARPSPIGGVTILRSEELRAMDGNEIYQRLLAFASETPVEATR